MSQTGFGGGFETRIMSWRKRSLSFYAAFPKYSPELRERTVRLVFESGRPIAHVASDLGVGAESLRGWVRQAEADAGQRKDRLTTDERERLKALERENRELRQANQILKAASVFFAKELDGTPGGERLHRDPEGGRLRRRARLPHARGVRFGLLRPREGAAVGSCRRG